MKGKKVLVFFFLLLFMLTPALSQEKPTLAVLDINYEDVSASEMKAIVEYLSAEMFKTGKFRVIDVGQRETILAEMSFSMSGCADESCALEIGRMLSAELIVVGNLSKVGSRYLVSVKMLETETSTTMGTATGKFNDLDGLIDGLEDIALELSGGSPAAAAEIPEEAAEEEEPPAETEVSAVEAEPAPSVDPEEEDRSGKNRRLLAWGCTGTGVAALGTGIFLVISAMDTISPYLDATKAYSDAGDGDDFDALFLAREEAYSEMQDANAPTKFVAGIAAAGVGAILGVVGVILFLPPKEETKMDVALMPLVSPRNNPGFMIRVRY